MMTSRIQCTPPAALGSQWHDSRLPESGSFCVSVTFHPPTSPAMGMIGEALSTECIVGYYERIVQDDFAV